MFPFIPCGPPCQKISRKPEGRLAGRLGAPDDGRVVPIGPVHRAGSRVQEARGASGGRCKNFRGWMSSGGPGGRYSRGTGFSQIPEKISGSTEEVEGASARMQEGRTPPVAGRASDMGPDGAGSGGCGTGPCRLSAHVGRGGLIQRHENFKQTGDIVCDVSAPGHGVVFFDVAGDHQGGRFPGGQTL